jgi:DNA-binding MarR family transcriptional regulator
MAEGQNVSQSTQETRAQLLAALALELRQFTSLGASLVRAASARSGMTATDLQVIDLLSSLGALSAGQLAELTGLTTGAITGMLNRLEEGGLIRRERDPEDGRRVIVQLTRVSDAQPKGGTPMGSVEAAWEDLASQYDDEQVALLLDFVTRGNALTRSAILRLRDAPGGEDALLSTPLGSLESGRLVVSAGATRLTVRADRDLDALYQARFEGPVPEVSASEGEVIIRYPRRMWALISPKRAAEVALSAAIPWRIALQVKASEVAGELGGLGLAELELTADASMIRLDLPVPSGVVPLRVSGNASDITIRLPEGVGARVRLKGRMSTLVCDNGTYYSPGNTVWLYSRGEQTSDQHYDVELASSVSQFTVTTG